MTPIKQREELELANRQDRMELARLKDKIEECSKKIHGDSNHIMELKKEEKILKIRLESSETASSDYKGLHEKVSRIKQECETLSLSANKTMRLIDETVIARNEIVERISMRDYILRQSDLTLTRAFVKKNVHK